MSQRIELRVSEKLEVEIKKYMKKNNFYDRQDAILNILEKKLIKTFLYRLKYLFNFK